jgi:phosphatidylglycerophosphate synthase
MLDKVKKKLKMPLITTLYKAGVKPNHLTILGLVVALIAMTQSLYIGVALFVASFIIDVMDGNLARKHKLATKFGGVLDSVVDKTVEILFIYYLSYTLNVGNIAVLAAGLSVMVSYVKHRAGGMMFSTFFNRAERMLFLSLASVLLPGFIEQTFIIFTILCGVVLIQLLAQVKSNYEKD